MTPTRADFEAVLLDDQGLGRWFASVGRDGSTRAGTNRDVGAVLRLALADAGYPILGTFSVTNDDLAGVPESKLHEVLDRATLHGFKLVRDSWSRGDDRPGPNLPGRTPPTPDERHRDYLRLLGIIEDRQMRLDKAYGDDAGRMTAGVMGLGIMVECETEF